MASAAEPDHGDDVAVVVGRHLRKVAELIADAHSLEFGPGRIREPWSREYQMEVARVLRDVLPEYDQFRIGAAYARCARHLEVDENDLSSEWSRAQRYLHNGAAAIGGQEADPPETIASLGEAAQELASIAPDELPYERLAMLLDREGCADLHHVGRTLERSHGHDSNCPLTPDELTYLQQLAHGDRVVDVAQRHGYSERSMYRLLSSIRKRLGVGTLKQAIAEAVRRDWI